jgi:Uma2 family endonuclease
MSIPVEEYLKSAYHPDMDYVEGTLEERNVGEKQHGNLQGRIFILLKKTRKLFVVLETRVQVSDGKYRVPDICAYEKEPDESVFTRPPLLCVEILSPEDRMTRVRRVVADYIGMGVQTVWVVDPIEKRTYVADPDGGFHETFEDLQIGLQGLASTLTLTREEIFSADDSFLF